MSRDARCAASASPRHGVITRALANDAGMSDAAIAHRIDSGRWIRLHPGVYFIPGIEPTWRSHLIAACDWARPGFASHRSAAAVLGLEGFAEIGRPEITVAHCHLPPRSGIRVHFTDRLLSSHRTVRDSIPVTTVERTLLDLGAVVPPKKVAIALDAAIYRRMTTYARVCSTLRAVAKRGRRGCGVLRRILDERAALKTVPNSAMETAFFGALVNSPFPMPELQHVIRRDGEFVARPDFAWPDRGIAIELDGYDPHAGLSSFKKDRRRFNAMTALGWRVIYGTWEEANSNPDRILDLVAQMWDDPPPVAYRRRA